MVALAAGPDERPGIGTRDGGFFEWQALGEIIPDMLLLVDREGRIQYANRVPAPLECETVAGMCVFDLAPPELREELRASFAEIMHGGRPRTREILGTPPDGAQRWYETHTGPVRVGAHVVAAVIVARDVTERKRAEAELRESEARCRTLIDHAPEALVIFDADAGSFVDANARACTFFDLSRDDLLSSNPIALSPPFQPNGEPSDGLARRYIEEALATGTAEFPWVHATPAQREIWCDVRLVRLPAQGRRLVRGSVVDVTRLRQIEAQLHQAKKLEALGHLAGGIAHDFNNVLGVIGMSADLLAERVASDPRAAAEVDGIHAAIQCGTRFTRTLLRFARHQPGEPEFCDLHVVIEEVAAILKGQLGTRVRLHLRLDPAEIQVRAERGQLEQVLLNLMLNARDAMPEGGDLTVRTGVFTAADGLMVHLEVEDTGIGMDEVTCRRAFDALFTTKGERGTGLGLSTVRTIVTALGGDVRVQSQLGAGSRFEVMLPVQRE